MNEYYTKNIALVIKLTTW